MNVWRIREMITVLADLFISMAYTDGIEKAPPTGLAGLLRFCYRGMQYRL
jgi:hypothetical protein